MANQFIFYGFPEECSKFEQRHPVWNETIRNLEKAMNLAFTRVRVMEGVADKLVYFFGRIVLEDFTEITLVCYHGYGVAASKLVRSMYENAVTLRYLHEHPDEAEIFMAYHLVQRGKLVGRMIETFGESILPADQIAKIRSKAAEVKKDFMVPVCDHPNAEKRLNHSWNKLDFVAMAKKTGGLGALIIPGYYMPIRHAHPTFGGLSERLEVVDGHMGLKAEAQPEIADRSLMTAYNCILDTLNVQGSHFKIEGLVEAMQVCYRDFVRVWSPDSPLLEDVQTAKEVRSLTADRNQRYGSQRQHMDRMSSFPIEDFEGMVAEIWQTLSACLYHAAYVRVYANTGAMRLAGSKRAHAATQPLSQTERELLQEDVIVFRAHFAGVLWQLLHLVELLGKAYKHCEREAIVTAEQRHKLAKALEDHPIVEEIRGYRNLSHQFSGVVITIHDATDAFIAHVFPPLDAKAPEQRAPLNEVEIEKTVRERELNMKLEAYCNHLAGYCEGLFRIIDARHKTAVIPRAQGFSITIPHSYQGKVPEGANGVIYVKAVGSVR